MNIKDLLKVGPENKSDTRFKLLVLFGLGFMAIFYGGLYLISKGIFDKDDFR